MRRKTNPLIKAISEASDKSRRDGHELIEKAKALDALRMKIRANYSEVFKGLDMSVHSLYMRTGYYKPTIEVSLNKLDGFKDPVLVKILDFLMDKSLSVKTSDYANWLNRDYTIEMDDVYVAISAYVRSDSPTCRKVKVGVQIQEVEQYELICD
jgi:DNA-binding transcriptional ArsR family regulator